jgi:AraC-like DNA-binding protein
MKTTQDLRPHWLVRFEADYHFRNLFTSYLSVHTFFVHGENWMDWWRIFRSGPEETPIHYEFLYGRWEDRIRYNSMLLEQVRREKKTVISSRSGFHDVFVPVLDRNKVVGVLVSGTVYRQAPSYDDLARQWFEITGAEPGLWQQDFARFVRICLRRPVLEAGTFESFVEVTELFARWLTARGGESAMVRRLVKLRDGVFSKTLPHEFWLSWALGENPSAPTPWFGRRDVGRWERFEIGIDRIPNTVLAVALEEPQGGATDPIRSLLAGRDLHFECFRLSQKIPQAAGGRFQDSTAAFLTAPKNGATPAQTRLELRDLARRIQEHLSKRFLCQVRIGVGRTVPTGESLRPSAQEALAALQLALHFRQPLVFYGDPGVRSEAFSFAQVQAFARRLEEAFARRENAVVGPARDRYVRSALLFFAENREGLRVHTLTTLLNLLEATGQRLSVGPEVLDPLRKNWESRLRDAGSTTSILETFREGCESLESLTSKPAEGTRRLRLDRALEDVRQNYADNVTAAQMARRWGFAPSDFSRMVKRTTGRSFPAYREALRLEHAKRLLKTSALPASQVATECGFKTAAYFGRVFKRVLGLTPDKYRKIG